MIQKANDPNDPKKANDLKKANDPKSKCSKKQMIQMI